MDRAARRIVTVVVACVATVALSGAAVMTGPWNEELPAEARPGSLHYVALGDSFSSGEGSPYVDPVDRYQIAVTTGITDVNQFLDGVCDNGLPQEDDCEARGRNAIENDYGWLGQTRTGDGNGCHRSDHAYPVRAWGILDREEPGWGLTFAACSGAVTADAANPSKNEPPQLDAFDSGPADIVTVGFGGNDIGFARLIKTCLAEAGFDRYRTQIGPGRDIIGNLDQCRVGNTAVIDRDMGYLEGRMLSLLSAVKAEGNLKSGAKVMVVGYPRLFPADPPAGCSTGAGTSLGPDTMTWLNTVVDRLNATLASTARMSGAAFIDTTYVLEDAERGYSHGLCTDDGSERWVNRSVSSDFNRSFHPKYPYHERVAEQVVDCWRTCLPTRP